MSLPAPLSLAFVTLVALGAPAFAAGDRDQVVGVVTDAYVKGVHINSDAAAMRKGFHPDFRMLVLADGQMTAVSLDEWAGRVERAAASRNAATPPAIKYEIPQVEIEGGAAVARVEIWRDGVHTFTDYLSLYKFPDGWKIVGKIFHAHPRP